MRRELWKEFRNHRMLVLMLFVFQAWTMGSNMHSKWLKHQTRRSVNNILWHLLCAGHHAWLLSGERKETQDSPYLPVYKVAGLNRPRHFGKPFPRKEATFSELMTIVKDKLLSLLQTNVKLCSPKFRRTIKFTSVQFSRSVVSDSLWPHEPQHARPPYPSPNPGVHPSNTTELVMPSNHLILCSLLLLLPSIFPSIRVFSNESLFTSSGQSIGVSASTSVLSMNTQDWSPLGWTSWISLQSKGLSGVFSNTTV